MIRTPDKHSAKAPSTRRANIAHPPRNDAKSAAVSKDRVQGEGNYEAARDFNEAEHKFVASDQLEIPGADDAKFQEIANKAKVGCPVSKLLKAQITMDAKLEA